MSQFIEKAVLQKLRFEETVDQVQERNLAYSVEEIDAAIDEAVNATRKATHAPPRS